jgi:hypothetical protein
VATRWSAGDGPAAADGEHAHPHQLGVHDAADADVEREVQEGQGDDHPTERPGNRELSERGRNARHKEEHAPDQLREPMRGGVLDTDAGTDQPAWLESPHVERSGRLVAGDSALPSSIRVKIGRAIAASGLARAINQATTRPAMSST